MITEPQIRAAYRGVDVLDPLAMFEVARKLMEPEIESLKKQIAEMDAEAEISDAVREKMSRILAAIAIALKGPELPLRRHGYHDLAELVQTNVLAVDIANAYIAALEAALSDQVTEAWLIEWRDNTGPHRRVFLHNAIADYRIFDPNATVCEMVCRIDPAAIVAKVREE